MIRLLNPKLHKPKDKKTLLKADIWPVDIIVSGKSKWVMSAEGVAVPYAGYVGFYSHRKVR